MNEVTPLDGTGAVLTAIPKPKDTFFKPHLCFVGPAGRALADEVSRRILECEQAHSLRTRKRRRDDLRRFHIIVEAIVANMAYEWLLDSSRHLAITRSNQQLTKKSRYKSEVYSKQLPDILDVMTFEGLDLIHQVVGQKKNVFATARTVIWPTETLLGLIEGADLELEDIGERIEQETIILKDEDDDLVEYVDTPQTIRWRSELKAINDWIAQAAIHVEQPASDTPIDVSDRVLHRTFRENFAAQGRLYGAFWINMKKEQRLADLMIEGQPVAELDYGQCAFRIAYGLIGAIPPEGDLYAIPGYEWQREGIKKAMNAMLNAKAPILRKPEAVSKLIRNKTMRQIADDVRSYHPAIAHLFEAGIGPHFILKESEMLTDVLLRLKEEQIVALPIHDCLIVSLSNKDRVRSVMQETFISHFGISGHVS